MRRHLTRRSILCRALLSCLASKPSRSAARCAALRLRILSAI